LTELTEFIIFDCALLQSYEVPVDVERQITYGTLLLLRSER